MFEATAAPIVEQHAPPDCAICERSLLVGEGVRIFRDKQARLVKVCDLCRTRALENGYEAPGFDGPRLRVQASGSVRDVVDRDALIEGLGNELAYLQQQLGAAESALVEQQLQGEALRAVTDKLRRQERELSRVRQEANPLERNRDRQRIEQQSAEIAELRQKLEVRDAQVARLQTARRDETDSNVMRRHAIDVFNASEHADRMSRTARTLGEPDVSVRDQGPGLPRLVHITIAWDIAWYEFGVKLDLGAGKASVHELGNGGDLRNLTDDQRMVNARWLKSGLVMA
jgi:hypothetical protein